MESPQHDSDNVLHESAHDDNIREELEDASAQAAVADLTAITGGESPTEAEHNAVRTRVNLLTQVLRDAGLIPSA